MRHFTPNRLFATAAAVMMIVAAFASNTGVYRTAITLNNGTQEIYPDSAVTRFDYSHVASGNRTKHLLNVINNGEVVRTFDTDNIVELNYGEMTLYEQFAGDWYLVASPNGEPDANGIMKTEVVSMSCHAVLPAPGSADYGEFIYCHIDSMAHRKGLKYDADFKLRYTYDETTQRGCLSMIIDDQQPLTAKQYAGDASTYAYWDATSTWYRGVSPQHAGGDTGNRYMYFQCRNLDTWAFEATELPATWTLAEAQAVNHSYQFPRMQEIHWIVALDIPFVESEYDYVGEIDIFSSARLQRRPYQKPVEE